MREREVLLCNGRIASGFIRAQRLAAAGRVASMRSVACRGLCPHTALRVAVRRQRRWLAGGQRIDASGMVSIRPGGRRCTYYMMCRRASYIRMVSGFFIHHDQGLVARSYVPTSPSHLRPYRVGSYCYGVCFQYRGKQEKRCWGHQRELLVSIWCSYIFSEILGSSQVLRGADHLSDGTKYIKKGFDNSPGKCENSLEHEHL